MLKDAMEDSSLAVLATCTKLACTCTASKMFRSMGHHDKAMRLLEESLQVANATEMQETETYASLLSAIGTIMRKKKDLTGTLAS